MTFSPATTAKAYCSSHREGVLAVLNWACVLLVGPLLCAAVAETLSLSGVSGLEQGFFLLNASIYLFIHLVVYLFIRNTRITCLAVFLVVLGFIFLGIRSMGWTIYSSFALSFYVSLCERICPLTKPLTDDVFLELCYAVILSAVGAAIVFNIGASTGGTDIVAMILNKYTSMPVGRALMVSDLGIVLVGAYLYGPATGLYCILGMILKSTVADGAIESINMRKVCTVVTSNPTPVRDFIVNELHRSATIEKAEGAYTHDEKWVLTTVLTRGQAQRLRLYVRGMDDHAFITIVNSSEIVGKGFRSI